MEKENNSLLYALLLSMEHYADYSVTPEDLRYMHDKKVNDCQIMLYVKVIEWLSLGKTYEEIYDLLDNITLEEYKSLDNEKQIYIQRKLRKDLNSRKNKEGERNYE